MDVPALKWHRIAPGWYRAELDSPTGQTTINVERRTRFKVYVCQIKYPDGTEWSSDKTSLESAKLACEWQLQRSIEEKLGWKATDYTETIQRITIYPSIEPNVEKIAETLKAMGFCQDEIRILRDTRYNRIDRMIAYRDDSATDIEDRLDFDDAEQIRQRIREQIGYVRIDLDTFKKAGETIKGPSLFEWQEKK